MKIDILSEDLKEKVTNYIREQIFERRTLHPGSKLKERELSRILNISRAPVREAFKELEEQGFITSIKYKGWFIADFSDEEAIEINSIRNLLEYSLFEKAIKTNSFTDADLLEAMKLNEELKIIAEREDSIDKIYLFMEKEMEFHMSLYSIAKKHYIWTQKLLKNLSYQIRLSFVDHLYKYGYMEYSIGVHELMLQAIKKKDLSELKVIFSKRSNRE